MSELMTYDLCLLQRLVSRKLYCGWSTLTWQTAIIILTSGQTLTYYML